MLDLVDIRDSACELTPCELAAEYSDQTQDVNCFFPKNQKKIYFGPFA